MKHFVLRPSTATVLIVSGLLIVFGGDMVEAFQPAGRAGNREFRPQRVLGPQRAIVDPPVLAARDVRGQVTDNELVIGVVVDGQARAYPINMLTGPQREIVNDVLGGQAIAATW